MGTPVSEASPVLSQLERVLGSASFRSADRSSRLLRFVVEQTLAGRADELKEYTIGAEALGRGEKFDPRVDAIARVEVSRLRTRLEQYYATAGREDPILITLPRGTYVPKFERTTGEPRQNRRRSWVALAAGVGAVILAIAAWLLWPKAVSIQPAAFHLDVELWPDGRLANVVGNQLAISPDGTAVVFVAARAAGGSELRLRRLDRRESTGLSGTEGARGPFFSPDGQWIGFWAAGKLKKVPLGGGAPMVLCDAPDLLGASWGADGNIIATLTTEARLWRVSAAGGPPQVLLDLSPQNLRLLWPQALPGSGSVLYSIGALTPDSGAIEVLRNGRRTTLIRSGTYGRYLPSGHLVYINQGTLYAQRLDLKRLEVTGSAVAVLSNVEYSPTFGFAQFDFSQTGILVYRRHESAGRFTIGWVDSQGKTESLVAVPGPYLWPRVSPDGRHIAVVTTDGGESHVKIIDRAGKVSASSLTEGYWAAPAWSLDSRFLALSGRGVLAWSPFPASGAPRTLLTGGVRIPWSFSPDGKRLAYYALDPATHFDLWTLPLGYKGGEISAGKPEPFLRTKAVETYPAFSPDGRWLAYASLQSGSYEIYVRSFPDTGREVQVSRGGGRLPLWSKQSSTLFYETEDHRMMTVPYRVRGGVFEAESPRTWTSVRLGDTGVLGNADLAPDGRLVALLPAPGREQLPNHVSLISNFFDEVERRLSAARR